MPRRLRQPYWLALIAMVWLAMPPIASAAASSNDTEESTRLFILAATVLGGLLIGLLLYQFSQRSSKQQFKGTVAPSAKPRADSADPKLLSSTILEQLKKIPAPANTRERVARTVSDIVTQTIEQQVGQVRQELSARYEQVVEEKRRNEAVLQRKYQETLMEKKQTTAILASGAGGRGGWCGKKRGAGGGGGPRRGGGCSP